MPESAGGEPLSLVDHSLERTERINRAFAHVVKAVELELADAALNPEGLSEEEKQKFIRLGNDLIGLARSSYGLLEDIATTTGISLDSANEPLQINPPQEQASIELPTVPVEEGEPESEVPSQESPDTAKLQEALTSSELYARIVDVGKLSNGHHVEPDKAIDIKVLGNDHIAIGGREITLKGHQLFLFNSSIISRGKSLVRKDFDTLGFSHNGTKGARGQAFKNNMNSLMSKLQEASGGEVITRTGHAGGARYEVSPNIVLTDLRPREPHQNGSANVKKN